MKYIFLYSILLSTTLFAYEEPQSCPVCYGDENLVTLSCKHLLCESCLKSWVNAGNDTCSLCRRSFLNSFNPVIVRILRDRESQEVNDQELVNPTPPLLPIRIRHENELARLIQNHFIERLNLSEFDLTHVIDRHNWELHQLWLWHQQELNSSNSIAEEQLEWQYSLGL